MSGKERTVKFVDDIIDGETWILFEKHTPMGRVYHNAFAAEFLRAPVMLEALQAIRNKLQSAPSVSSSWLEEQVSKALPSEGDES